MASFSVLISPFFAFAWYSYFIAHSIRFCKTRTLLDYYDSYAYGIFMWMSTWTISIAHFLFISIPPFLYFFLDWRFPWIFLGESFLHYLIRITNGKFVCTVYNNITMEQRGELFFFFLKTQFLYCVRMFVEKNHLYQIPAHTTLHYITLHYVL